MANLLLEIGTEELPAGYIEPALKVLCSNLLKKLAVARIDFDKARTMGTPRRLVVDVSYISTKQKPMTTEIMGPPKKVGFDENGTPTVAAKKFAERVGVSIKKLKIKETPKGLYLFINKTEKELSTKSLLKNILPEAILSIPFPKTMRWADFPLQFARPIHSILALIDSEVISFRLENLRSGRSTFGHRFMDSGKIKISEPAEYIEKLRYAHVIVDVDERKQAIEGEISAVAEKIGGRVLPDEALVHTVKNLVEYPAVVAGGFDEKFLLLPREILITAMREHQKYFAVIGKNEELIPCFIAVNNTAAKDPALVTKGHERVLRARLEDAQFFYQSDLKTPVDDWVEKLHGVLFQAKLGTLYDKVMRIERLSAYLADTVGLDKEFKNYTTRAAQLCKVDLVSQVVGEFPKLQGIMGRVYATASGEPETVACAIEEYYRPTYSGGPLPETLPGALLGIADKLDSICGCFSAGLIPTGASDPYALRRQGIGVVQIILQSTFSFSLKNVINENLQLFRNTLNQKVDIESVSEQVYVFLQNRIIQLLADEGYPKDVISAVASISIDHVPNVWRRVHALAALKHAPDFEPLAIAFKRVVNIIKQAKQTISDYVGGSVDERLFEHACESLLLSEYQAVEKKVTMNFEKGDFDKALHDIASLRPSVDAFFDGVMVLTDDIKLRNNRLAMLNQIAGLFENVADFSKIST